MKKYIVILLVVFVLVLCTPINAHAQIKGGFFYSKDYNGNPFIYFQGTNTSQYDYNIEVIYLNEYTGEKKVTYFTPLYAGNYFTIGPNDNWLWQTGEILIIKYANDKSVYWKCGYNNNLYGNTFPLTFKGNAGKYCSADGHRCTCPGYEKKSRADWYCKHCGHPKHWHIF